MFAAQPPQSEDADKGSPFFRTEWRRLLLLVLSFGFLSLVTGVLASTYGLSYLTTLGVSATSATEFGWMARIPGLVAFVSAALIADMKGRLFTLRIGTLMLLPSVLLFFPLVNLNTFTAILLAFIIVEVPIDFASGGIAALFTESFPTRHRNRGAGLSYHAGALISGVVLTVIVPLLVSSFGNVRSAAPAMTWMLFGLLTVSLLASLRVPETLHIGLLQSAAPKVVVSRPGAPPYDTT
jgi:MFS family permease